MLVISRKVGEQIYIGHDVVITVIANPQKRNSANVRIGIEAPKSIGIWRGEVLERMTAPDAEAVPHEEERLPVVRKHIPKIPTEQRTLMEILKERKLDAKFYLTVDELAEVVSA